jgi:general secretion pathway protein K
MRSLRFNSQYLDKTFVSQRDTKFNEDIIPPHPPLEKGGEGGFERIFSDERGVALILTLWILVLLTVIVAEFSTSMRAEINITRNFKEESESYYLALAGIEKAKEEIMTPSVVQCLDEEGRLIFKEIGKGEEKKEPPQREDLRLERGTYSYEIIDEESKLNLNTATADMLRRLFSATGVKDILLDTIVDSIIDWRDPDDLHHLNGAEEDYYRSLPEPYSSKDGNFDAVEELLLVKGMTPEIFYGSAGKDEEDSYKGVAQFLTVKSSGMININTAPMEVLEAVYGSISADLILAQRNQVGCITAPVANIPIGTIQSAHFSIISTGGSKGSIHRVVKAIVEKGPSGVKVLYWNDNCYYTGKGSSNKGQIFNP